MNVQFKSPSFSWGIAFGFASPSIAHTIPRGLSGDHSVFHYLGLGMPLVVFLVWLCLISFRMKKDLQSGKGVIQSMARSVLIPFWIGFFLSFGMSDLVSTLLRMHDTKISGVLGMRIVLDVIWILFGGFGYWRYRVELNHQ